MKKIMFKDKFGLTLAVLNGNKTMTRREVKIPKGCALNWTISNGHLVYYFVDPSNREVGELNGSTVYHFAGFPRPAYHVGEVVAIAQSYREIMRSILEIGSSKISNSFCWTEVQDEKSKGWNNKMFVKASNMLHQIRITDIHIERLQDIRWADCFKEGIKRTCGEYTFWAFDKEVKPIFQYPQEAFQYMIDKISGKGTWKRNPYVFVYEFELVD